MQSSQKQKNRIFFAAFAGLWGALVLWNALLPDHGFSESENRKLEPLPEFSVKGLLDGDYMADMDAYLSDQFPARPAWVGGASLWDWALGRRCVNGIYIGRDALLRDDALPNDTVTEANIEGINAFATRLGLPTAVMLVPGAAAVQTEKLPAFAAAWDEGAYIESVYGALLPNIQTADAYEPLKAHSEDYIYYRTDHHWTSYGAFLAMQRLAPALGLEARSAADYDVTTVSTDFYGTSHSRTGFPLVRADSIQRWQAGSVTGYEVYRTESGGGTGENPGGAGGYGTTRYGGIYFDDYLDKKDQYSYFLGPLQPYVTIHTASASGKKLIIFKDSYAHCLAPMLLSDYSEIRLVDLRAFKAEDYAAFVEAEAYDQALFLYSVDTFAQQLGPARLQ